MKGTKRISWINQLQFSEQLILGNMAVFTGLSTGIGIWLFKRLIDLVQWVAFDNFSAWLAGFGAWTVAIVPVLGGLLARLAMPGW